MYELGGSLLSLSRDKAPTNLPSFLVLVLSSPLQRETDTLSPTPPSSNQLSDTSLPYTRNEIFLPPLHLLFPPAAHLLSTPLLSHHPLPNPAPPPPNPNPLVLHRPLPPHLHLFHSHHNLHGVIAPDLPQHRPPARVVPAALALAARPAAHPRAPELRSHHRNQQPSIPTHHPPPLRKFPPFLAPANPECVSLPSQH